MRKRMILAILAVLLLCSGCSGEENPYRVDTVVWIPVNPTDMPTASEETEPAASEEATEESAQPETTEPEAEPTEGKPASSGRKPSGGGSNSNKNNGSTKQTEPKDTEPKDTEPEDTEPAATKDPEINPTETAPPETAPVETEPVGTEPTEAKPAETEPALYDISGYSVGSLEYGMADAINAVREENSLGTLNLNSRLCAIASCRANEISQVWSHTRPDGRNYATVLSDYGYGAGSAMELLVYVTGNGDAQSIVGKWLESDSHRQSLLGGYSTLGIGVYRANGYTYVCCLLVG